MPQPTVADYTAWRFWMDLLQLAGIVVVGIYSWISNRRRVNEKRFKALERKVGSLTPKSECRSHRQESQQMQTFITELQKEVDHLPSQDDIGRVHARMDEVAADMNKAVGELNATRRQLDLVLEALMRRDEK